MSMSFIAVRNFLLGSVEKPSFADKLITHRVWAKGDYIRK